MPQPKILTFLSSLSPWEIQRFRKFVASPFFNADGRHRQLLELLLEKRSDDSLDREFLHSEIFPSPAFDYARITNLLSDLTRLGEDFLAFSWLRERPLDLRLPLLTVVGERNHDKWFQAISRDIDEKLARELGTNEWGFFQQFRADTARNTFFVSREHRKLDQSLPNSILALDRFYVASMLKAVCQLLNRQNVISEEGREVEDIQKTFIEHMRQFHHRYENYPIIQGYFLILMTLLEPEKSSSFFDLTAFLQYQQTSLPSEERKPMYQYAQNYCIKQINRGHREYLAELFGLYQEMINQSLIYYQGYISPADVKNIVSLGVRLREFEWTEAFLNQFEHKIAEEYRTNSMIYNRAYLYYGQGKQREALRLLNQVEFQDVFYYLGAKSLLLKIYYELNDQEGLEALLHAFDVTLRRHKLISAYRKKPYLNLIRFTRKLNQLRLKAITYSPKAYQQAKYRLREQIQATHEIVNINWLEEQMGG
ncbi:MAG: hypothetical protein AAF587_09415 [Bacteroidota bacterium]